MQESQEKDLIEVGSEAAHAADELGKALEKSFYKEYVPSQHGAARKLRSFYKIEKRKKKRKNLSKMRKRNGNQHRKQT